MLVTGLVLLGISFFFADRRYGMNFLDLLGLLLLFCDMMIKVTS